MDMDSKRNRAKLVAILSMWSFIIVIFLRAYGGERVRNYWNSLTSSRYDGNGDVAFSCVMISMFIAASLDLWVAFALVLSTDPDRDAKEALQMAKRWKGWTIFFLVLVITYGLVSSSPLVIMISFSVRGIFLCVVNEFIWELEDQITQEDEKILIPQRKYSWPNDSETRK